MEKAWLYETLFFQLGIVTVKEKKDALKTIQCRSKLVLCMTGITLR